LQIKPSQARLGPAGILRPISTSILPGRRVVQSNIERARLYIPKFALTLQVTGASGFDPSTRSGFARIPRFIEMLEGLIDGRFTVNVILQTGREYANMFITDFRAPRIAGRSGSITFSIDMQEVVLASSATVTKAGSVRAESKHKPKKAKGRGAKKPVSIEEELRMSIPYDLQGDLLSSVPG